MALVHRSSELDYSWPNPESLDPASMEVAYNPLADELTIIFRDPMRPVYIDFLDWTDDYHVGLRIDDETKDVLGIQLDSAMLINAVRHPSWKPVIEAAMALARRQTLPPSIQPALRSLVQDVRELSEQ